MSEENVEVVKRSVEAYLRGDIDAYLEGLGDDAELDFSRARGPYRGVHRGREGARALFAGFREAFSSITPVSTEYMEVGDKVVLAARVRFRGRGSGVEVGGGGMGAVYTLRDGKIVRYEQFQSKAEALEAAGLSE
jgi:ketosteroid isomerase-like protein